MKLYFVNFQSREKRLIEWQNGETFDDILYHICAAYEYDIDETTVLRLYHVESGKHWQDDRTKIQTIAELQQHHDNASKLAFNQRGCFYCYFGGGDSPQRFPQITPTIAPGPETGEKAVLVVTKQQKVTNNFFFVQK